MPIRYGSGKPQAPFGTQLKNNLNIPPWLEWMVNAVAPDPNDMTAAAMPMVGNVVQLAQSDMADPLLKRGLSYLAKKYPRMSKVVSNSKFITDPHGEHWPSQRGGIYSPAEDAAQIAINDVNGMPKDPKSVLRIVGHEIYGHGIEESRGMRGTPQQRAKYQTSQAVQDALPYNQRPREVRANKMGDAVINSLKKAGIL
jgi:hypothetical protein